MESMKNPGFRKYLCLFAGIAVLCLAPAGIFAQENTQEYELDFMTVTAQKTEENVQDVPMSISVFSDVQLKDAEIGDTKDLVHFAPNVYMRDAGGYYQTVIRGVTGFIGALHGAAAYYVDDINRPLAYMQNPVLFDVERVEVLKGPQGALYGRNSESGVINIVTKQPDNVLRGRVYTGINFYDTSFGMNPGYQVGASVSGPVIENTLYAGFAGQVDYSDGFRENLYKNDDQTTEYTRMNGRLNLRWTPTQAWDIALVAEAMDHDDDYGYFRFLDGPFATKYGKTAFDGPNSHESSGDTQSIRARYAGEKVNFLSVTGRNYFEDKLNFDYEMSPYSAYLSNQKVEDTLYSQEFRLSSADKESPLQWVTGFYGYKESIDTKMKNSDLMYLVSENRKTDIDIKGYAVFGQATYTLFNRLHLTAGLRYDYVDMEGKQHGYDMFGQTLSYRDSHDDGEFLPKLAIAYDFTDQVMGYASVSKGYLAGGYNYSSASSKDTLYFGPEYTWNYEIGAKTSWLNNKLLVNVSAFYIDMKDKQLSEINQNLLAVISNAAEAHSYGAELEIQARPVPGLELFGGFGYTWSEIDDWTALETDGMGNVYTYDYDGKDLTSTPRFTYNLGMQYRHMRGFLGRIDVIGTGPFYHDTKNQLKEDAYTLVNLKLGYEAENFDIMFWCKNIFDKGYEDVRFSWGQLGNAGIDGEPRQFGVTVNYRF